jgi:hypothetical protein
MAEYGLRCIIWTALQYEEHQTILKISRGCIFYQANFLKIVLNTVLFHDMLHFMAWGFNSVKCKKKEFQIRIKDVKEQGTVMSDNIITQQQMDS